MVSKLRPLGKNLTMNWVFAGSKHEARIFMDNVDLMESHNLLYGWVRPLDSVRVLIHSNGSTKIHQTLLHLVGTAIYRKDAKEVLEQAAELNIPIIDYTAHGTIIAPSLEIAHVFCKPLGISSEWRYQSKK